MPILMLYRRPRLTRIPTEAEPERPRTLQQGEVRGTKSNVRHTHTERQLAVPAVDSSKLNGTTLNVVWVYRFYFFTSYLLQYTSGQANKTAAAAQHTINARVFSVWQGCRVSREWVVARPPKSVVPVMNPANYRAWDI